MTEPDAQPALVSDPMLQCPACTGRWTVETVLDHCRVSWPAQRWLWFECPGCGRGSHIELRGSRVSIGGLDGAPGPCFFAANAVEARGLRVTASEQGVTVAYNGRNWRVAAKR